MKQEKLENAIVEARRIALLAADFLNGKNTGTPYQSPDVVLATIQGRAERLVLLLTSFGRGHHGEVKKRRIGQSPWTAPGARSRVCGGR